MRAPSLQAAGRSRGPSTPLPLPRRPRRRGVTLAAMLLDHSTAVIPPSRQRTDGACRNRSPFLLTRRRSKCARRLATAVERAVIACSVRVSQRRRHCAGGIIDGCDWGECHDAARRIALAHFSDAPPHNVSWRQVKEAACRLPSLLTCGGRRADACALTSLRALRRSARSLLLSRRGCVAPSSLEVCRCTRSPRREWRRWWKRGESVDTARTTVVLGTLMLLALVTVVLLATSKTRQQRSDACRLGSAVGERAR